MWQLLKCELFLFATEIAVDKTKAFCPVVGCDGVCSGVPGSKQPTVCKEVEFSLSVINCMILRALPKLIHWHNEVPVICTHHKVPSSLT